jgi:UMF1 family MFS transporter
VGIGRNDLIGALLLVQFIGLPCSLLFGRIAGRIGGRSGILIGLAVYTAIAGGGYFLSKPWHFWLLAILVGTVQGGTQALSRSLFAKLIPKEKSGEWFGFYSVSGRFAGIAGPFLFAATGHLTGSSRFGILTLILFFAGGALLLRRVNVEPSPAQD